MLNCSQLAPAGTGSELVARVLEDQSGYDTRFRHQHHLVDEEAPCFVITLREPAERLSSGVRYELLVPHGGRPRITTFGTAANFVDALQAHSPRAKRLFNLSVDKREPASDGSFFLTSLCSYLSRVPDQKPIFFTCTSRLDNDLKLLMRNTSASFGNTNRRLRQARALQTDTQNSVLQRSFLDLSRRNYLNSLFPCDMRLVSKYGCSQR